MAVAVGRILESGVRPCALGAGHDIPNPPGPSGEVFGVDRRAGPDIPNPPGRHVRFLRRIDRDRIGSKSDQNRDQNRKIGSKLLQGVT